MLEPVARPVVQVCVAVINVTLPDEKQNYVHRIGRVGRAERFVCYCSVFCKDKGKVKGTWMYIVP